MSIKDGILYGGSEGNFRLKKGIKFVRSAKGAFGRFPSVHFVRVDGKTQCGRTIPDTWIPLELDLESYYDQTMTCSHCLGKFNVLERIPDE